jgi:hypothetical protein
MPIGDKGNESTLFIFGVNILAPLLALILLRIRTRFPIAMAGLLFVFGPLIGTLVFLTISGLSGSKPDLAAAIGIWPLAFLVALPIYGLSVVSSGVVGWSLFKKVTALQKMHVVWRTVLGAVAGVPIGFILNFVFLAINSLNPLPVLESFSQIFADSVGFLSFALQGTVAGLVCGGIVASFIEDERTVSET